MLSSSANSDVHLAARPALSTSSAGSDEPRSRSWIFILLVGLGLLIYAPGHNAPFIYDDINSIVYDERGSVHQLWPWGPLPLQRALGTWTFQINYALHGLN